MLSIECPTNAGSCHRLLPRCDDIRPYLDALGRAEVQAEASSDLSGPMCIHSLGHRRRLSYICFHPHRFIGEFGFPASLFEWCSGRGSHPHDHHRDLVRTASSPMHRPLRSFTAPFSLTDHRPLPMPCRSTAYLQKAMAIFPNNKVVPTYYVSFTLASVCAGAVVYREARARTREPGRAITCQCPAVNSRWPMTRVTVFHRRV